VEDLVEEHFNNARSGTWIEFEDSAGRGFAQPDIFVSLPSHTICFEVKLRQTDVAYSQIASLYRPLLRALFRRPVLGVAVFHYLTPARRPPHIHHLSDLLALKEDQIFIWHVV
jgi:hypothetical protein